MIEEFKADRFAVIITEIPYQVNKTTLIERIASLVREGRLDMISDLRDESDRTGMRIVIELKRNAQPQRVMNQLYKYTQLQSTFGVNMLALVNKEPRSLLITRACCRFILNTAKRSSPAVPSLIWTKPKPVLIFWMAADCPGQSG